MTVKEFFDIEPIQKNGILTLLFAFFVSYLQLFLFKNEFIELDKFDKIILTLAVSVFWIISEIPTYLLFVNLKTMKWEKVGNTKKLFADRIVASFGFSLVFWMVVLTYIGFEFEMTLKEFIRTSIIWMTLKMLYHLIFWLRFVFIETKNKRKKKKEQQKL
jgi:hypothetical protein